MGSHICPDCGQQVVAAPGVVHDCPVRARRAMHEALEKAADQAFANLDYVQEVSFRIASEHGFWTGPEQDNVPTKIALIHEEASEALKVFREQHALDEIWYEYKSGDTTKAVEFKVESDGTNYYRQLYSSEWIRMKDYHNDMIALGYEAKPEGFGIELADAIIRIADLAQRHGLHLGHLIRLKTAYNETRPHMHGRKV